MENSMEVPQKKLELPYDPTISLLVLIQKNWKQNL